MNNKVFQNVIHWINKKQSISDHSNPIFRISGSVLTETFGVFCYLSASVIFIAQYDLISKSYMSDIDVLDSNLSKEKKWKN